MNDVNLSKLQWLPGQWEGIQGPGIYHEEWERISDNEFKGKAYLIKKGEITNPEKLTIHCDQSGTYYIADVTHNPKPVSFKLTGAYDTVFIFENPEHDFPQRITYKRKEDDSLLVTIEAVNGGKNRRAEFFLKRIG